MTGGNYPDGELPLLSGDPTPMPTGVPTASSLDALTFVVVQTTGDQMADACEMNGMAVIVTIDRCNAAAEALGLSDTTATNGIDSAGYRPYGCVMTCL